MRTPIILGLMVALLGAPSANAETIFGTVMKTQGSASSLAIGGSARILTPGAQVGPGGMITAGPTGSLTLRLTPCSSMELSNDASVSLDDLQLVRKSIGVTARQGEITQSRGQGKFVVEAMELRVNIPGAVIAAPQAAVFSVVVGPSGDSLITVLSGYITITNSAGETIRMKANEVANGQPGGGAGGFAPQSADDNPAAQEQLQGLQQAVESASLLGLICQDTLDRLQGEIITIGRPGNTPETPEPNNPRPPSRNPPRPPVSPEQ